MALPYNEWFQITQGPGLWKLMKSLFRDEEEDQACIGHCTFMVKQEHDQESTHLLKVMIEKVEREGRPGRGIYSFSIEGIILEIDGEGWPHRFVPTFNAMRYDSIRRLGSLKIGDNAIGVAFGPKS